MLLPKFRIQIFSKCPQFKKVKMIEIVIPTCNRPEMLRTALKSVVDQTIRSQIGCVIVSEGGGNKRSSDICTEFFDLPINYIFHDPPLSAMEHARILSLRETTEKYTAILHDDDWWCPSHLELAFYNLEKAPYASVYHSGVFEVNGESSVLRCDNNFCFWFGSGYSPITSVWDLSEKQVILSCLLHTPARYSSLVAKANFLKSAIEEVLATGNAFDNDRMLTIKLSQQGNILYNPIPQVFVRTHSTQDQWSYVQNDRIELTAKTTEWIVAQSGENPIDLARRFVSCVCRCPEEAGAELRSRLLQTWCLPRLSEKLPDTEFRVLLSKMTDSVEVTTKLDSSASNNNSIEVFLDYIFVKMHRIRGNIIWWSKNWKSRFRCLNKINKCSLQK